ncbi:RING-type E3 ubiquitin transferase [Malassezia sp. CBS 17886]|nr:RING-type E3 ubiquitin transferase [Malassezia sp. CBS 17886]
MTTEGNAVAALLPQIAELPRRDDLASYALTDEHVQRIRERLYGELWAAVPVAHLLPPALVRNQEDAMALLAQSDWSLSQAQRRAEARLQQCASKGKQAERDVGAGAAEDVPLAQAEYSAQRRGMACGHVFRKGEPIFRCRDCSFDDTCVQCAACFENSIHAHEEHDVVFSVADESGACCDCGDEEAWTRDLRCAFHSRAAPDAPARGDAAWAPLAAQTRAHAAGLGGFVELLLTFVLQSLTHAPEQTTLELGPDSVEAVKRRASWEDVFAVDTEAPQPFTALLWNDEKHSFNQVADKILEVRSAMSMKDARAFAERVDRHGREVLATTPEVRRLVLMARRINIIDLVVTIEPAFDAFVEEVAGCVVAFLVDLASCALYVPQAGGARAADGRALKVLITSALLSAWQNEAWERAPTAISRTLFDPTHLCKLDALLLLDTKMWKGARLGVRHLLMDLIGAREAKQEIAVCFARVYPCLVETFILRDREPEHSAYHMTVQLFSVPSVARHLVVEHDTLDMLLCILQALFASSSDQRVAALTLPAPPPARGQANANAPLLRQQKCYHVFHDVRYLLGARDVQREIVRHSARYLAAWLRFFALFHAIAPDQRAVHAHVEFESELWIQVFHISSHLGRIAKLLGEAFAHASPPQLRAAVALAARTILRHCARLTQLDPAAHPATSVHTVRYPAQRGVEARVVQFSVAALPVSFHHPMHWLFAEMLKQVGGPGGGATEEESVTEERATGGVEYRGKGEASMEEESATEEGSVAERERAAEQGAAAGESATEGDDVAAWEKEEVEVEGASMHDVTLDAAHGRDGSPLSSASLPLDEDALLVLLESPLRVAVKLAQIRCNVWVRNGFAIRSQAYHYRDSMWMRDIMYDQDLFLQQCGVAFVDPDRYLITLLDRFDLVRWFSGHTHEPHPVYDAEQLTFMAEELLLLLVVLVSEVSVPAHWSMEQLVRRELVHYLALGAGTYSEVTKQIPERYTDHVCFDRELARVARFRSPDGTADLGMYELRNEFLADVQPFFHHYSRNQRERAEELLAEERARRARDGAPPLPLAPPRQLDVLRGTPFCRIADTFVCASFVRIVFFALANAVDAYDGPPESLVNAALHLVLLALSEQPDAFPPRLLDPVERAPGTRSEAHLLALLLRLAADERLAACHGKLTYIVDTAARTDAAVAAAAAHARRHMAPPPPAAPNGGDARRAAARSRQAAIMRQFSAQQKSVLASLESELSDESEDEGDEDAHAAHARWGNCILCQERLDGAHAFGMLAHVQESRLVRTTPPRHTPALHSVLDVPLDLDRGAHDGARQRGAWLRVESARQRAEWRRQPHVTDGAPTPPGGGARAGGIAFGYPSADHTTGLVAVSCGHSMHVRCFHTYVRSIEQRHALQVARNHPEDLSRFEFVCPLCKSLGNVLLPVPGASGLGALPTPRAGGAARDDQPLSEWVRRINIAILKNTSSPASVRAEHQERDRGTGCFLPFYAHSSAQPHNAQLGADVLGADDAHMVQRSLNVLQLLSYETGWLRMQDRRATVLEPAGWVPPHADSAALQDSVYLPDHLVAYTLAQLEISQRGIPAVPAAPGSGWASGGVADTLSDTQLHLVRSLLDLLRFLARDACRDSKSADAMRQGLLKRLMPHWAGEHAVRSPLLLRSPLGVLVEAAVLMPEHLHHVAALMYYVTLVQAVFGIAQPAYADLREAPRADAAAPDRAAPCAVFPHARWLVTSIVSLVGYVRGNITLGFDHLDDAELAKVLYTYTLPFLRRAAMLQRIVCGEDDACRAHVAAAAAEPCEYRRLLRQLQIPAPADALPMDANPAGLMAMLVEGWTKHAYAQLAPLFRPLPIEPADALRDADTRAGVPSLVLEHPDIYELLPLPRDLAVLLQQTQQRTCAQCHTLPPTAALCLFCGDVLCEQSYCCSDPDDDEARGECNQHMERCGGRVGAHFRVGSNVVVLLYQGNGCFSPSPYLNSHGEVDRYLLKARPQRLHVQRYDELRRQWLAHGLANAVTRKIEASIDPGGWVTF